MTKIKVFQGTRSVDAPRLCDSCSNGVVMRGPADSQEHVHCSLMDKPIRMRVTECNRYIDRSQPSLWAMKEIAWVLAVGLQAPEDRVRYRQRMAEVERRRESGAIELRVINDL